MTGYWLDCAGFGVWVEDAAYEPEEAPQYDEGDFQTEFDGFI